jgi:hypothetical protein
MSNFFKNFPLTLYKFGDEPNPTLFQNISAYISIIADLKDNVVFHTTEYIGDYDRPDSLSYKLYNTTEFYWTFYYLNDDIAESGWPLSQQDLLDRAKKDYPNWTITTEDDIADKFVEGDTVEGLSSAARGTVIKRYLDLGQIIVKPESHENFSNGELIRANNEIADQVEVKSQVAQYNSTHHYEDTSGEWTDINPRDQSTSGLIPVTYFERIKAKNEQLKEIKVFRPDVVPQIQSEFNKLLLRGF